MTTNHVPIPFHDAAETLYRSRYAIESGAALAAELRLIANQVEQVGELRDAYMVASLNLYCPQTSGDRAREAVDELATALDLATEEIGDGIYSSVIRAVTHGTVNVSTFTRIGPS